MQGLFLLLKNSIQIFGKSIDDCIVKLKSDESNFIY
jgi:hypothetical protein